MYHIVEPLSYVNLIQGAPLILKEFIIVDSNLWFVRLDLCVPLDLLAVGNKVGQVWIEWTHIDISNIIDGRSRNISYLRYLCTQSVKA